MSFWWRDVVRLRATALCRCKLLSPFNSRRRPGRHSRTQRCRSPWYPAAIGKKETLPARSRNSFGSRFRKLTKTDQHAKIMDSSNHCGYPTKSLVLCSIRMILRFVRKVTATHTASSYYGLMPSCVDILCPILLVLWIPMPLISQCPWTLWIAIMTTILFITHHTSANARQWPPYGTVHVILNHTCAESLFRLRSPSWRWRLSYSSLA